jgi:hypothetical protein
MAILKRLDCANIRTKNAGDDKSSRDAIEIDGRQDAALEMKLTW